VRRLGPPSEVDHTAIWLPLEEAVTRLGNSGDRAVLARFLGK
jgi:8-oxo-dGTP diphosphatase